MITKPKTLLLAPDYPPTVGGIQRLLGDMVANTELLDISVITRGRQSAPGTNRVVRLSMGSGRASLAALNVLCVAEGLRQRPYLILNGHVATAPAASILKRALRRPVVCFGYGQELTASRWRARAAVRTADAFMSISAYTDSLLTALGVPAEHIHRLPPAVGPAVRVAGRPDSHVGITVARMTELYKGHDTLIRALPLVRAKVPDVQWIFVGDGPLRRYYEELARSHGVADVVRFVGVISDSERDLYMGQSRVFAMLSRLDPRGGGEGFGIAYLEAARLGLPVVAGREGGARDAVDDGVTGLLADATDAVDCARAIIQLLLDDARNQAMGSAAISWASKWTPSATGRALDRCARQTLGSSRLRLRSRP